MKVLLLLLAALCVSGCKPPEESQQTAIIGAILIDGTGGPPMSDSVVVVAGSRIRAVGNRANMPIPAGVEKINGMGKFLVPGLIDLNARLGSRIEQSLNASLYSGVTSVRSAATDLGSALAARKSERDAQLQTANLFIAGPVVESGPQPDSILIALGTKPAEASSMTDEARKRNVPVTAQIRSLPEAERLVAVGVSDFIGMIGDTEDIDPSFLARLRDLRIVFTPTLAATGPRDLLDRALRNTAKLAAGGVLIGAGSDSGHMQDELELLVQAGLSPMDAIVAATKTGAFALRKSEELGTIEPGREADLMLVTANPIEDVRNLRKIDRIMLHGEWVDREHLTLK